MVELFFLHAGKEEGTKRFFKKRNNERKYNIHTSAKYNNIIHLLFKKKNVPSSTIVPGRKKAAAAPRRTASKTAMIGCFMVGYFLCKGNVPGVFWRFLMDVLCIIIFVSHGVVCEMHEQTIQ
jgi:hypothetical protein